MNSLTETIKTVIDSILINIHTCIPGRIEKYNYKNQQAEVTPLINTLYHDNTSEKKPIVSNVPVIFPRTADAIIHIPINRGDTGLLLFSESALEKWLSLGGQVDPGDERKFDLSDGIFIPGLYPFNANAKASGNNDLEILFKNSSIILKNNGQVRINDDHLTID